MSIGIGLPPTLMVVLTSAFVVLNWSPKFPLSPVEPAETLTAAVSSPAMPAALPVPRAPAGK